MQYKLNHYAQVEVINGETSVITVFEGVPVFEDNEGDAISNGHRAYFVEVPSPFPVPAPPPVHVVFLSVDNLIRLEAASLPEAFEEIKRKSQQAAETAQAESRKPSNNLVLAQ